MKIFKETIESKFLDQFSIVTITFNDSSLKDTFLSYKDLLINGAQLIVVNGGESLDSWCSNLLQVIMCKLFRSQIKGAMMP